MNSIDDILTDVLKAEGWDRYTNHPSDRGGPTKWGITLKAYQDFLPNNTVTVEDIKALKEVHARAFYRQKYIIEPGFDKLHPLLIPLVVDSAVNHGQKRAAQWLQKAVGVEQDGVIGPLTLAALNAQPSVMAVYLDIVASRVRFYGVLVTRDHSQAVFASGWNNRAAKFIVVLADLLKQS